MSKYEEIVDSKVSDEFCKVIETGDRDEFTKQINELLKDGWKVSSTSCGFVNSEAYDFCNYYHAILLKNHE